MLPAVSCSFDVAFWFRDRALDDGEYLQPQKVQRLMYLAQAYYAVFHAGRMLMPSVFVAETMGPIEPNVYRALSGGWQFIETERVPEQPAQFFDSIWRRFGHHSVNHLTRMVRGHPPYKEAFEQNGPGAEIGLEEMRIFYGRGAESDAPEPQGVVRSRVVRSHTGRPVAVRKWMPGSKPPAAKED
ncbi:MAG: hypothetical protein WD270_01865 [Acetobacterales bacterium]